MLRVWVCGSRQCHWYECFHCVLWAGMACVLENVQSADDAGYSLVGADATMDLLAGNDASTELLVEVKSAGGLWPRVVDEASGASAAASGTAQEREDDPAGPDSEPEPAPEDDAGWREWLTVCVHVCGRPR